MNSDDTVNDDDCLQKMGAELMEIVLTITRWRTVVKEEEIKCFIDWRLIMMDDFLFFSSNLVIYFYMQLLQWIEKDS